MAVSFAVIGLETNGIPELGRDLPFVKQARCISLKEFLRGQLSLEKVFFDAGRVVHIDDALGLLFCCCCLSAPFGAFYENGSFTGQLTGQDGIGDSGSVCFILAHLIANIVKTDDCRKIFPEYVERKTDDCGKYFRKLTENEYICEKVVVLIKRNGVLIPTP